MTHTFPNKYFDDIYLSSKKQEFNSRHLGNIFVFIQFMNHGRRGINQMIPLSIKDRGTNVSNIYRNTETIATTNIAIN